MTVVHQRTSRCCNNIISVCSIRCNLFKDTVLFTWMVAMKMNSVWQQNLIYKMNYYPVTFRSS